MNEKITGRELRDAINLNVDRYHSDINFRYIINQLVTAYSASEINEICKIATFLSETNKENVVTGR